jgi:phosphoribosylaminoimidazole (AIR) synthetase
MGCGFAIYCAKGSGGEVVALAEELSLTAMVAGQVEAGDRRVVLEFDDATVEYGSGAMDLNPRRVA